MLRPYGPSSEEEMTETEKKARMIRRISSMEVKLGKAKALSKKHSPTDLELAAHEVVEHIHTRIVKLYQSYSSIGLI